MENNINQRYADAKWAKLIRTPMVVGAGSTGSMVAYYLSKQVTSMTVFDDDVIEPHNQGVQLYGTSSIGKKKVHVLGDILKELSRVNTTTDYPVYSSRDMRWEPGCFINPHVFSCTDNIESRKALFNAWCDYYGDTSRGIFIDIRMAAEFAQVFVVKSKDDIAIQAYRESLEGEFPETMCTYQMTVQCASLAAGMAVQAYNNACIGLPVVFESYFNGPTLQWTYNQPQYESTKRAINDDSNTSRQVSTVPADDEDVLADDVSDGNLEKLRL